MLAVGAIAVPSASARFSQSDSAPCLTDCSNSAIYSQPLGSPRSEVASGGYDVAYVPSSIAPSNGGFDWGDAGIGAGAALVIIATATGGAVMFGRHQAHSHLAR
jgi:hypothetical protein